MDLSAALESRRYSKAMAMNDAPDPKEEFPTISDDDLKRFEDGLVEKG